MVKPNTVPTAIAGRDGSVSVKLQGLGRRFRECRPAIRIFARDGMSSNLALVVPTGPTWPTVPSAWGISAWPSVHSVPQLCSKIEMSWQETDNARSPQPSRSGWSFGLWEPVTGNRPRREGRSPKQIGRKGLSNKRRIVGGKLCLLLNHLGLIVDWDCDTANVYDGSACSTSGRRRC